MAPLSRWLEEEGDDDDEETTGILEIVVGVWLVLIMIGVGASCERPLLKQMVGSRRAFNAALIGISCQFLIMPLVAYLLSLAFRVDEYTALGFILAGCMPGGGPSNVFTMLSHGVLELSVFMTVFSTVLAMGMTPLLIFIYSKAIGIDQSESVETFIIVATSLALLMIPLCIGFAVNYCKPDIKKKLEKVLGVALFIVINIAGVALGFEYWEDFTENASYQIIVPGILFFPIGTGCSYALATLLQYAPSIKRTIVLEVGMQNITLAFLLLELMLDTREQRSKALGFPLIYTFAMYFFSIVLVPIFRYFKNSNEAKGIPDEDPHFFGKNMSSAGPKEERSETRLQRGEEGSDEELQSTDSPKTPYTLNE